MVQQVCAYTGIFRDIWKWLPIGTEGAGWQNDDSQPHGASQIQMVQCVNGGLRLEAGKGVETQWDVVVQIETASRVEWKQSAAGLKGGDNGTEGEKGEEMKSSNQGKQQEAQQGRYSGRGREWAELRERAVYWRGEGSQRETECNKREILNRRGGWWGMGEKGAVESGTDSDGEHVGQWIER